MDVPERPNVKPQGMLIFLGAILLPFLNCPLFINIDYIFKTKKEKTIMVKKSSWLIVSLFVLSVGFLCSVPQSDGGNTELQVPYSCDTKTGGSSWRCT